MCRFAMFPASHVAGFGKVVTPRPCTFLLVALRYSSVDTRASARWRAYHVPVGPNSGTIVFGSFLPSGSPGRCVCVCVRQTASQRQQTIRDKSRLALVGVAKGDTAVLSPLRARAL